MQRTQAEGEVAVVGGSVIGLACAFRVAGSGRVVTVFDPDTGADGVPVRAAAWVAGGMLAPYGEAWPGEPEALALGLESLAAWPALLEELAEFAGEPDPDEPWTHGPIRTAGDCLLLAADAADDRDLTLAMDWALQNTGHGPLAARGEASEAPVRRITRRRVRELEPGLTGTIRSAFHLPGEGSVDNRRLLGALRRGCIARGVRFVQARITRAAELDAFADVILCAGAGAAELAGLPIRNVKGEVLRLFERPGCEAAPRHVVRAQVRGRPVYLVPRAGGLVVGATQYEHGEDRQVTAGGVRDLLADAESLFPAIGEYELREAIAGLRPMSHDNLPYLGLLPEKPLDDGRLASMSGQRVIAACGHGRNGVSLTAVTATAVCAYLEGGADAAVSEAVRACDPARVQR